MGTAINFSIGGTNTKFVAVARDTQAKAEAMSRRVSARISSMTVAAGVLMAKVVESTARHVTRLASRMGAGLRGAFDLGGRLSDISAQTGAAVKDLMVLELAMRNNGISSSDMAAGIGRAQRAIFEAGQGNRAQAKTFAALGISIGSIQNLDPVRQFTTIGEAINRLQDPTARTTIAMNIFGRSGARLLTAFSDRGGMSGAADMLGTQADVLQKNATKFDEVSDRMGNSGLALQGFFVGMAEVLADPILKILEKLGSMDLVSAGQKAGGAIMEAYQVVTYLGEQFQAALAAVIQFAMIGINKATEGLSRVFDLLKSGFALIAAGGTAFIARLSEGVLGLALDVQTGFQYAFDRVARFFDSVMGPVIDNVSAALEFAIQKALEGLSKIPILSKRLGLDGFASESFDSIRQRNETERGERMAAPLQSYSDMRAENAKAGWVQGGMNIVEVMDDVVAAQMNEAQKAYFDALADREQVFSDNMIEGFKLEAIDRAQSALARREGIIRRFTGEDPAFGTSVAAAPPAEVSKFQAFKASVGGVGGGLDAFRSRISGSSFSAGGLISATRTSAAAKPGENKTAEKLDSTNEKLDAIVRGLEQLM